MPLTHITPAAGVKYTRMPSMTHVQVQLQRAISVLNFHLHLDSNTLILLLIHKGQGGERALKTQRMSDRHCKFLRLNILFGFHQLHQHSTLVS